MRLFHPSLLLIVAQFPIDGVTRTPQQFQVIVKGKVTDSERHPVVAQVLLERDVSQSWQQFLDGTESASDGNFTLTIQRPGTYWLLAARGKGRAIRRGACLVDVRADGSFAMKALPETKAGRFWNGLASDKCDQGQLRIGRSERPAQIGRVPRRRHP